MTTDRMTSQWVYDILRDIELKMFPHLSTMVVKTPEEFYFQLRQEGIGNGRKWRLSEFMTKSEVVQTVFMAYLAWIEHEARELFLYKGEPIFSPHYDVDALVGLCKAKEFDVR